MKDLSFRPICDSSGEFLPWVNSLRNLCGAYVIRSKFWGEVLYVGESHTGNLGKTLKRHFYAWRDSVERRHHVYDRDDVEVAVRVTPPNSATGAQNNLIRSLAPRDNAELPAEEPF
jgi:hypothetical protein